MYHALVEATNRGDVAAALALFADDASVSAPPLCAPNPCVGKAAIQREWEALVAARLRGSVVQLALRRDLVLEVREEHRADPITAAGVDRVISKVTVTFVGTRISRLALELDLTDPQTSAYAHYGNVSAIVRGLTDARNRGDAEAAASFFAEDITFTGGMCLPCSGRAAILAEFQRQFSGPGVRVTVSDLKVTGMIATFRQFIPLERAPVPGVERTVNTVTMELRDGKIASWRAAPDLSDPQAAALANFIAVNALLRQVFDARNRGDAAAAAAFFAEDAIFQGSGTAPGAACFPCTDRAGIQANFENQIRQGARFGLSDLQVSGNTATFHQTRGQTATRVTVEVRDGKIVSWSAAAPVAVLMPRTGRGGLLDETR